MRDLMIQKHYLSDMFRKQQLYVTLRFETNKIRFEVSTLLDKM